MRVDIIISRTIAGLRSAGYEESTIGSYHGVFVGLQDYMQKENIEVYTPEIGELYLPIIQKRQSYIEGKRKCRIVINHLNNCLAGIPAELPRKKRPPNNVELYPEFELYLAWCETKNLSAGTVRNYRDIASSIAKGFHSLGSSNLKSLTPKIIIEFCRTLAQQAAGHKHNVVFVLKNSLQYFLDAGLIDTDLSNAIPFERYDHASKLPSIYTKEEIASLLEATGKGTPLDKRNFAMLLLAARTGLRSSDVVALKFEDIDWANDKIGIMQQKTGATLYMPLYPEIGEAISDYILNGRPVSEENTVFVTHNPPYSKMVNSTFNNIVEKAMTKAGIDISRRKHGPHALRHSLASEMLSRGETIKAIADQLGHQSIQSTTIYAKVDTSNLGQCALQVPEYREISCFSIDDRLEIPVVGDLAHHIVDYTLYKRAMGQKAQNELKHLSNLARFSLSYDLSTDLLPQLMIETWIARRDKEKSNSLYSRISVLKSFASYLNNLGFSVCIPEVPQRKRLKKFSPHIFSDDEIQSFFAVADSLEAGPMSVFEGINFYIPTLFRVLLGCGLRVSEALHLKRSDVDLDNCTLYIREAKNNKDRIVVMSSSLVAAMKNYITVNAISADWLLFGKRDGNFVGAEIIYSWFRKILEKAGIPHKGKDYGPRVHDFRHTFAVRSLNQMLSESKPLYAALPILKDYLGHSDIRSTEKYLHLVEWMFPQLIASMNEISDQIIPKMEASL